MRGAPLSGRWAALVTGADPCRRPVGLQVSIDAPRRATLGAQRLHVAHQQIYLATPPSE